MPEQKYYTDQRLNQICVFFTNLSKDIIEIVKDDMDYLSTNVVALRRGRYQQHCARFGIQ